MRDSTLCIPVRGSPVAEVLLGFKKVRFGAGKYTGFGGRVERGESVPAAAIRELEEESGLTVSAEHLQWVAQLTFLFPAKPSWSQGVHLFVASRWHGKPAESEEMIPVWFPVSEIPYAQMWQDAAYWLPPVLAGQRIRARFTFRNDNETIDEVRLEAWGDSDA